MNEDLLAELEAMVPLSKRGVPLLKHEGKLYNRNAKGHSFVVEVNEEPTEFIRSYMKCKATFPHKCLGSIKCDFNTRTEKYENVEITHGYIFSKLYYLLTY